MRKQYYEGKIHAIVFYRIVFTYVFYILRKKAGKNSVIQVKGGEADAKGDLGTGLHQ